MTPRDWFAARATRFVDSLIVGSGFLVGAAITLWVLGAFVTPPAAPDNFAADIALSERYEAQANNTLGPVDMNATTP